MKGSYFMWTRENPQLIKKAQKFTDESTPFFQCKKETKKQTQNVIYICHTELEVMPSRTTQPDLY